jgi:hypothetical protein
MPKAWTRYKTVWKHEIDYLACTKLLLVAEEQDETHIEDTLADSTEKPERKFLQKLESC